MKPNKFPLFPFLAVFVVFTGRFFLTPEFLIYPYFSSIGMMPYRDIIDQHLPGVFFGPLSISSLPFLGYLLSLVLFVIIVFLFGTSVSPNKKDKRDLIAAFTLVGVGYLLELEHLWLELVVVVGIWLSLKIYKRSEFISGLLVATFIISRPFFVGYWLYIMATRKSAGFLKGSIAFGLIVLFWFYLNNNHFDFLKLLSFNVNEYKDLAYKLPDKKQLIVSILAFFTVFSFSKVRIWPAVLLAGLSAYPRFEMHHLFGIILGPVLDFIPTKNSYRSISLLMVIWVLVLTKWWPTKLSGEFFVNNNTMEISDEFVKNGNSNGYILGGPDSVYYLANISPCNNYYLPSLPWYHNNNEFVQRQIIALEECKDETVLVNKNSSVDGQQLVGPNSRIYKHIKENYSLVKTHGDFEFYTEQE